MSWTRTTVTCRPMTMIGAAIIGAVAGLRVTARLRSQPLRRTTRVAGDWTLTRHRGACQGERGRQHRAHSSRARRNRAHSSRARRNRAHSSRARRNRAHSSRARRNRAHSSRARRNRAHSSRAHRRARRCRSSWTRGSCPAAGRPPTSCPGSPVRPVQPLRPVRPLRPDLRAPRTSQPPRPRPPPRPRRHGRYRLETGRAWVSRPATSLTWHCPDRLWPGRLTPRPDRAAPTRGSVTMN